MLDKSLYTLKVENDREPFPLTMLPLTGHTKEETAIRAVVEDSISSVARSLMDRASVPQTMNRAARRRTERLFREQHETSPENEIRSLLCTDAITDGADKDVTDRLSALKTAHPEVYKQQEESVNRMIQTYLVSKKPAPESAIMETLASAVEADLVPSSASRNRVQMLKDRAAVARAQGASRLTRNAARMAEEDSKKRSSASSAAGGGKRPRRSK